MGRAKDLEELYQWIYDNKYEDDQIGLLNFTELFPEKIEYDMEEEIINNKLPVDKNYIEKNEPYFRHYPGYGNIQSLFFITFNNYPKKYINDFYDFSKLVVTKTKYNTAIFTLTFSTFLAGTFGIFLAPELNAF